MTDNLSVIEATDPANCADTSVSIPAEAVPQQPTPAPRRMNESNSLIIRMADALKVDPKKLMNTLSYSCFRADSKGRTFSPEEVMLVLLISEQLGLNPLRREIWAFRGKDGAVQAMVSIDGWKAIMLRQKNFNGYEIRYADTTVNINGRDLPEWCECAIYLKNTDHPVTERVWLDEVIMPSSPVWAKSPRRMLHHRALIQAIRFAFAVSGISDGEEQIADVESENSTNGSFMSRSNPKPALEKPVEFDNAALVSVTDKAILMARKRNNYDDAFKFAQLQKTEEARQYVTRRVQEARDEDLRKAMESVTQDVEDVNDQHLNDVIADQSVSQNCDAPSADSFLDNF